MYSFPNLETVQCSIFSSNYCFFAYKQISQETGILIFLRIFHSLLWPTPRLYHSQWTRCFFLEFPCFFYDPVDIGNLISGSFPFSKSSLNICKFSVHVLLMHGLENCEHYFDSMGNEGNCAVVWTFFGIALLWDWNEYWPFPVLWPLLNFPNFLAYYMQHLQHHLLGFEIAQLEFLHLHLVCL